MRSVLLVVLMMISSAASAYSFSSGNVDMVNGQGSTTITLSATIEPSRDFDSNSFDEAFDLANERDELNGSNSQYTCTFVEDDFGSNNNSFKFSQNKRNIVCSEDNF